MKRKQRIREGKEIKGGVENEVMFNEMTGSGGGQTERKQEIKH